MANIVFSQGENEQKSIHVKSRVGGVVATTMIMLLMN